MSGEKVTGMVVQGAVGAIAGAVSQTASAPHVQRAAVANAASATTHALRHGAKLGPALGAGATALVGGPAVVAGAIAAAPFVAGAAAIVAIGFGIKKLLDD